MSDIEDMASEQYKQQLNDQYNKYSNAHWVSSTTMASSRPFYEPAGTEPIYVRKQFAIREVICKDGKPARFEYVHVWRHKSKFQYTRKKVYE